MTSDTDSGKLAQRYVSYNTMVNVCCAKLSKWTGNTQNIFVLGRRLHKKNENVGSVTNEARRIKSKLYNYNLWLIINTYFNVRNAQRVKLHYGHFKFVPCNAEWQLFLLIIYNFNWNRISIIYGVLHWYHPLSNNRSTSIYTHMHYPLSFSADWSTTAPK